MADQLDVIKSIASRSQTVHVLIGTYELLAFRNLSAQLSRRSVDLHFSRYRAESADDIEVFQNAVFTFQKQLRSEQLSICPAFGISFMNARWAASESSKIGWRGVRAAHFEVLSD